MQHTFVVNCSKTTHFSATEKHTDSNGSGWIGIEQFQAVIQRIKIAFKIALGKEVDEILGRGKVKQAALSKDMHGALCLYRHSINNRRNVEIDTDN